MKAASKQELEQLKATSKQELEQLQAESKEQLDAQKTLTAKYQAIAEPPKEKFFASGHYTAEVDLTALEVIANLGPRCCCR